MRKTGTPLKRLARTLLFACVIPAFTGCGADSDWNDPARAGNEPRGGSMDEGPAPLWLRIQLKQDLEPSQCTEPDQITILQAGRYSFGGPCPSEGMRRLREGLLREDERVELSRLANLVLGSGSQECAGYQSYGSSRMQITELSRTAVKVYESDSRREVACYRGGQANVEALLTLLGRLKERYYLNPSPGIWTEE